MRDHKKNIGRKVYTTQGVTCSYMTKFQLYEGILVAVDEDYVKIYIEEINQVERFRKRYFNNTGNSRYYYDYSWGYTPKNVVKFIESRKRKESKPNKKYDSYSITTKGIAEKYPDGLVPYDKLGIDASKDNKYLHRYKRDLERLFKYFSEERLFYVKAIDKYHPQYQGKTDLQKEIKIVITKYYFEGKDKTKPFKVEIEFIYKPFGWEGQWTKIHKWDKFVNTVKMVEGEKYGGL